MVRVTALQWCNRLEVAKDLGDVLVIGWNVGHKNGPFAIGYDTMELEASGEWRSLTTGKIVPPTEFKPVLFAKPQLPENLSTLLKECEEEARLYEESKKNNNKGD